MSIPIPRHLALAVVAVVALTVPACGGGGGSSSTPPTSPSPSPIPGGACGAIGTAIVNGTKCPTDTGTGSVVLINMRDSDGPTGACSGTVIAPRAVLTAAHCLVGSVTTVQIFLGTGPQIVASSFMAWPNYRENDPNALDVGVVLFAEDIGRSAIPLLLSRDARVGETAIIAGWGRDQNEIGSTLRAGQTVITAVGSTVLQTQFSATNASVCLGDSGGPLLLSEGGTWAVGGVTSAVTNAVCNSGTDFYAKVRNPDITSFILGLVPNARQL